MLKLCTTVRAACIKRGNFGKPRQVDTLAHSAVLLLLLVVGLIVVLVVVVVIVVVVEVVVVVVFHCELPVALIDNVTQLTIKQAHLYCLFSPVSQVRHGGHGKLKQNTTHNSSLGREAPKDEQGFSGDCLHNSKPTSM